MADFETLPVGTTVLLERVARTFREYEVSHRAKAARAVAGTMMQQDRLDKAKRNSALAAEIEKVLAEKREGL
jgi:hypothetical protein